jgi:predicted RNase H-like HicB family nuclease
MLYPVYVHIGDKTHSHGITIPDLPGCFSYADTWEELPHAAQEAAERYCDGKELEIPTPTSLEKLAQNPAYHGGVWMLVEIDTSKLHPLSGGTPAAAPRLLESPEEHPEKMQEREEAGQAKALVDTEHAKVEVRLPDDLLKIIDEYAASHNLTRSAVLARAALNLMTKTGN